MIHIGLILSFATLIAPIQAKQAEVQPKFEPLLAFYGTESLIQERQQQRILTADAWHEMLGKHYGTEEPAQRISEPYRINADTVVINFSACMVLAFFDGTVRNSQGLRIAEIEDGKDRVRIRLTRLLDSPLDYATLVNPYALLVTPRTTKRIEVEGLELRDGAEVWVTLVTFPALAVPRTRSK